MNQTQPTTLMMMTQTMIWPSRHRLCQSWIIKSIIYSRFRTRPWFVNIHAGLWLGLCLVFSRHGVIIAILTWDSTRAVVGYINLPELSHPVLKNLWSRMPSLELSTNQTPESITKFATTLRLYLRPVVGLSFGGYSRPAISFWRRRSGFEKTKPLINNVRR